VKLNAFPRVANLINLVYPFISVLSMLSTIQAVKLQSATSPTGRPQTTTTTTQPQQSSPRATTGNQQEKLIHKGSEVTTFQLNFLLANPKQSQ
jgi:hypothetical protein